MDEVEKLTIISNRSGSLLRDRVIEDFALKLEEKDREKFTHANPRSKNFPSGEVYVQLAENVRGRSVHIIAGFYRPELYHLRRKVLELDSGSGTGVTLIRDYLHSTETDFAELLKILDATRRSGAEKISVYLAYFPDSRQDKKDEPRVPISAKLKFDQIEDAGKPKLNRIGVIDIHAKQEQGFTNYPVDHITARAHLVLALKHQGISYDNLTLVCPDPNDYQAMRKFANQLSVGLAVILKSRKSHGVIDEKSYLEGDPVKGRVCAMFDDMIDTAGTTLKGSEVVKKCGAERVIACATHFIGSPKVNEDGKVIFVEDRFKEAHEEYGLTLITTDSIARTLEYLREHKDWLTTISTSPLLADLIYCNETRRSHGAKLEGYMNLARTDNGSALERFLLWG